MMPSNYRLQIIVLTLSLSCPISVWSQVLTQQEEATTSSPLDLLREEVLDTVSLTDAVYFITPETTDAVAKPDTYRVEAGNENRLKLVSPKGKRTLIIEALSTNHTYDIATPIALFVQDDKKFPHVVLLLPGGRGLEAVGSYDAVRSRGITPTRLTFEQIQQAVKEKQSASTVRGGTGSKAK